MVRLPVPNPRQLILHRKHSIRKMVLRRNNVPSRSILCEILLPQHGFSPVSYERYSAIVKSPLTNTGTITKSKSIVLIWMIPIPLSIHAVVHCLVSLNGTITIQKFSAANKDGRCRQLVRQHKSLKTSTNKRA